VIRNGWTRFWGWSWWAKGPILAVVAFFGIGIVGAIAGGGGDDSKDDSGGVAEATASKGPEETREPTEEPTREPTAEPTEAPTAEPTAQPTPVPTAAPTQPPAQPTQPPAVSEYPCEADASCNCSDFPTHAEAQRIFEKHGGSPSNDWAGLDGNGNGSACESLP
jgi:hypothetical protein